MKQSISLTKFPFGMAFCNDECFLRVSHFAQVQHKNYKDKNSKSTLWCCHNSINIIDFVFTPLISNSFRNVTSSKYAKKVHKQQQQERVAMLSQLNRHPGTLTTWYLQQVTFKLHSQLQSQRMAKTTAFWWCHKMTIKQSGQLFLSQQRLVFHNSRQICTQTGWFSEVLILIYKIHIVIDLVFG